MNEIYYHIYGTNVFSLTIEINKYTNETIYLNNF